MIPFAFKTTEETYGYCLEVMQCLVSYCHKSEEAAIKLVNRYWQEYDLFDEYDYRLHEEPYYWAMCICHDRILGDNRPDWFRDPTLWPPPKAYFTQRYGVDEVGIGHGNADFSISCMNLLR
jgi:hypothetical protein